MVMVTSRLFRTAGACLTMCPFVMCGGERGDGRVFTRVSTRWIFDPRKAGGFGGVIKQTRESSRLHLRKEG